MHIKIKKRGLILKILVGINIICWYHFFYLFKLPSFINDNLPSDKLTFINVIIGLVILLYLYCCKKRLFTQYYKKMVYFILVCICSYFILTIYTVLKFPRQSLLSTLISGSNFLQIINIPLYIYIFELDDGEERLIDFIDNVVFIWCVIITVQSLLYFHSGTFFGDFSTYFGDNSTDIGIRVYGVRIFLGVFGNFTLLYNFAKLYNKKLSGWKKTYTLAKFILEMYCLIVIQQTRQWYFVIFACIAIQIILGNKPIKTRLREFISLVGIIFILYFSGAFTYFISQLNTMNDAYRDLSTMHRLYAFNYYWHVFLENPLFGNGFLSLGTTDYYTVLHGSTGFAYYSDVGFVGLLGHIGLFSIVYFIWPVLMMIKSIKLLTYKKKKLSYKYNLYISVLLYVVLSSVFGIITHFGSAALFPIIVATFLYREKWS